MSASPIKKPMPNYMRFVLGGSAGMLASCIVQPFDVVKTRMQISGMGVGKKEYANSMEAVKALIKSDGLLGLYLGIGAALLRQATYTTARLGVYTNLNDFYKKKYLRDPTVFASILMGVTAGAVGAFVGTPAEVALIRMQTDGKLPPQDRRHYTNVANALMRITTEEGVATLWRGCIPTVGRAMVVNVSQLASYSQFKSFFRKTLEIQEGFFLHLIASLLSGLLTTIASMPLDIAKTRIQNMKVIDGKPEFKGMVDVMLKIVKAEGVPALWKGFTPYFLRLGPHTVFTLVFLEQLTKTYKRLVLGEESGTSGI